MYKKFKFPTIYIFFYGWVVNDGFHHILCSNIVQIKGKSGPFAKTLGLYTQAPQIIIFFSKIPSMQ